MLRTAGEWESLQALLLQGFLRDGDVAVDIGAHIGSHTIPLGVSVYPSGTVHAFEVQAGVARVLRANVELYGLQNMVHVHGAAVSDAAAAAEGSISVRRVNLTAPTNEYLSPEGNLLNNVGGFSIASDVHVPVDDELSDSVPVVTIDSFGWYSESSTCPRLMKLDVEGVELKVLEGARETIRACKPVLHVENNHGENSKALIDWLNAEGYSLYFEVDVFQQPLSYSGRYFSTAASVPLSINLLAVPTGFDIASYPQASAWLLDFLTPIDVNQPELSKYVVKVPVIHDPVLSIQKHDDSTVLLQMVPVVKSELYRIG